MPFSEPLIVPFGYRLKEQYRNRIVGHWKMNVGGAVIPDLSGNGNHGTRTNMANPPTALSGWAGQGDILDGVDDYIKVDNQSGFNGEGTVSMWVKRNTTIGSQYIFVSKGEYFICYLFPTGLIFYPSYPEAASLVVYNITWDTTNWHHIVITADDTSNVKNVYFDGVLKGSNSTAWSKVVPTGWYFGVNNSLNGYWLSGLIDDVRIFSRALSADEVMHSYAQQEDEWDLGLDDDIDVMQGIPIELLQSGNLMGVR